MKSITDTSVNQLRLVTCISVKILSNFDAKIKEYYTKHE